MLGARLLLSPLHIAHSLQVTKPQADTWSYRCNAGFFWMGSDTGSSTLSLRCDSTNGAMTPLAGAQTSINCVSCTTGGESHRHLERPAACLLPVPPLLLLPVSSCYCAFNASLFAIAIARATAGLSGHYCTGTDLRQPCPGGTFGNPGALLTTAACSGQCVAGYFCPQASTSSTPFQCGGVDKYCPQGSGAPTPVPAGFFSTPVAASPNLVRCTAPR